MNISYVEVEETTEKIAKPMKLKLNPHLIYDKLDLSEVSDKNYVWDLCLAEAKMTSDLKEALINIENELELL